MTRYPLAGGVVLYDNLAAYLFRQGLNEVIDEVHAIAETAAARGLKEFAAPLKAVVGSLPSANDKQRVRAALARLGP